MPAKHIKNEAQRVGFGDLHVEEYNGGSRPHLRDWSRAWIIQAIRSLVPRSLIRIGEVSEENIAQERTKRLVAEVERECAGAMALVKLDVITGRKPKKSEVFYN